MAAKVLVRLRPYRVRIILSLGLLIFSVPFTNFHPLVWGYVADGLVEKTLTPKILDIWLAIMFGTYLIGVATNAVHSYLLEKTGQAVVRDLRSELFAKFEAQSLAYHRDTNTGELVTHRIGLLRQATRIIFLDEGKLTGDGTHEQLVATCPGYSDAYQRWHWFVSKAELPWFLQGAVSLFPFGRILLAFTA